MTVCIVIVPEIGFTMPSGSVRESMDDYVVTVQSSVAGGVLGSTGLVEIYTLQGVGNATGNF